MSVSASILAVMSDYTQTGSVFAADDPTCDKSEVSRLLWTMITLAAAAGLMTVVRPRWAAVAALVAADLVWVWIDMEGPVLLAVGSHGLHLADVPVVVTLPAVIIAAARLWLRRDGA